MILLLQGAQPIMKRWMTLFCLATRAPMRLDSLNQVSRPTVMEEEEALSDTPQRSGPKLIGARPTLSDAVRESFAHVVDEEVGEEVRGLVGKRRTRVRGRAARNHLAGGKRRRVAWAQPTFAKMALPFAADGVSGAGVGGASIRMKLANASMSERTAVLGALARRR